MIQFRRLRICLAVLAVGTGLWAQSSEEALPSSWVTVVSDEETFRMTSPVSGELSVEKTFMVKDAKGCRAAAFHVYTDAFRVLSSFSGEVTPLGGGKAVKLKQKDLIYFSLSEGLADDGASYSYVPEGRCPMIVRYSYKISYRKGIASFPTFIAVQDEKVDVTRAHYTIDVPEGFAIKQLSGGMDYAVTTEGGRERHEWCLNDYRGYVEEDGMPSLLELVPYVYASPVTIDYGGYAGAQSDWKEIGGWLALMQEGRQELPPEASARLQEMTKDCKTSVEKLAVLYRHLRNTTRYVSIQLGIGGLRPLPASDVYRTGFGDCKGLSNYLRAMLAAVGVPSDYYIIHTERAHLLPGYASVGQMNHAMLAVPLPELGDTAWVECTNPVYPLGYRHSRAAGHEVVLVHAGDGEQVRIPAYPDSLSREVQRTDVQLFPDGSARLTLRRELFLDHVEPYIGFRERKPDVRTRMLTRAMKLQAEDVTVTSVNDNFDAYPTEGRAFVPGMQIDYTMATRVYANVSRDRLFVPLNPVAQQVSVQKSRRINDFVIYHYSRYDDYVRLQVPEGFQIESLPKDENLDTQWGRFFTTSTVHDGVIEIHQQITILPGRHPAATYEDFRSFARSVNKCYAATLVLKKND